MIKRRHAFNSYDARVERAMFGAEGLTNMPELRTQCMMEVRWLICEPTASVSLAMRDWCETIFKEVLLAKELSAIQ
jgi:hypothetical protein